MKLFYAGILMATLLIPVPAIAATFCVSSGNQLNEAMNAAEFNNQDDVIKIEMGTHTSDIYALESFRWQYVPSTNDVGRSLQIVGGWSKNNNCQTQVTNDPTQTVLDAQNIGPVFFADLRHDFSGSFSIKNVTLTRGRGYPGCLVNSIIMPCEASGILIEAWALLGATVTVDNILVNNGSNVANANVDVANFFIQNAGILRVRNSIFGGNVLNAAGTNTGGLDMAAVNGAVMYITNNSIYNNIFRSERAGLHTRGTGTITNNAIANNTSSSAQSYAFHTNEPTGLTIRNNHFQNSYFNNGSPFAMEGTTTGDPGWSASGVRMVPNGVSKLRDSGINNPVGGIPAIDFSGTSRIINSTIDRGAVEAPAITRQGPLLTASAPLNNSNELISGSMDDAVTRTLNFTVSDGLGAGTTQLSCHHGGGPIAISANGSQIVQVGGTVLPVVVKMYIGQNGVVTADVTVSCTATRENVASVQEFSFFFRLTAEGILKDSFE